jgi:hypothetical protein
VKIRALVSVAAVAATVMASPAHAEITIGPDLGTLTPLAGGYNCNASHNCTLVNESVGAGFGSPALVSPVNGYITHIRVRTGPGGSGNFIFRYLRPAAGGGYTGEESFGVIPQPPLPPNTILQFPGFPIDAGDAIGIDCCQAGFDDITTATVPGSGNFVAWGTGANAALAGGETRAPDSDHPGSLLMMNADVTPLDAFLLDNVKVKGTRVIARATVPNPGFLAVSSRLLKPATVNVTSLAPGRAVFATHVRLSTRVTKAGRARLRRAGKLKVRVTYTASYGSPTTLKKTVKR